jgi:hypothetical protein
MFRPTPIALSLNLTVKIAPHMSMVSYLEGGGSTVMRYLPSQQLTPQGYVLQ